MGSYTWCKRESRLSDPAFCRLGWDVRGFWDALCMLAVQVRPSAEVEVGEDVGTTPDIAWHLRCDEMWAENCLVALEAIGYVERLESGAWRLAELIGEQEPETSAQRVKAYRERRAKRAGVTPVTERYDTCNDVTVDKIKKENENREEINSVPTALPSGSSGDRPEIYGVYEREIGLLTPMIAQTLGELEQQYTRAWVIDAIGVAARSNVRNLRYVEGILKRWARDGRGAKTGSVDAGDSERVLALMRVDERMRAVGINLTQRSVVMDALEVAPAAEWGRLREVVEQLVAAQDAAHLMSVFEGAFAPAR